MDTSPQEFSHVLLSLLSRNNIDTGIKKLSLLKMVEILGLNDEFKNYFLEDINVNEENFKKFIIKTEKTFSMTRTTSSDYTSSSLTSSVTTSNSISTNNSIFSPGLHNATYFINDKKDKSEILKLEVKKEDEEIDVEGEEVIENEENLKKYNEIELKCEEDLNIFNLPSSTLTTNSILSLSSPPSSPLPFSSSLPLLSSSSFSSNSQDLNECKVIEFMTSFISTSILSISEEDFSIDFDIHLRNHLMGIVRMIENFHQYIQSTIDFESKMISITVSSPISPNQREASRISSPLRRLKSNELIEYQNNLNEIYLVINLLSKLIKNGRNREFMWKNFIDAEKRITFSAFFIQNLKEFLDYEGLKNDTQWIYMSLFILWSFSFDLNTKSLAENKSQYEWNLMYFLSNNFLAKLQEYLLYSSSKKIHRMVLGILHQLCKKEDYLVINSLLSLDFLKVLKKLKPNKDLDAEMQAIQLKNSAGNSKLKQKTPATPTPMTSNSSTTNHDEDYEEDLHALYHHLSKNAKELSSFEKWKHEVDTENLCWGILHTKKFWLENYKNLEEKEFLYVKKLIQILNKLYETLSVSKFSATSSTYSSSDLQKMAIILYDLGEFNRLYPNGRVIFNRLQGKDIVMKIFEDIHEEKIQSYALDCISKAVISNWDNIKN